MTLNRFDAIMRKDNWPDDTGACLALIRVADTMFACREWFEAHGVAYTGADLVAMTRLAIWGCEFPDPSDPDPLQRPF